MKVKFHFHDCHECGEQFRCDGELEQNYDGEPEVVCDFYHRYEQRACQTCAGTDDEAEA